MGAIPLDLHETFGWATDIRGLPALLETLATTSADELARREKIVKGLRATHYTLNGTMQHIRGFLLGSASDLQCVKLPKTTKGTQTCLRPPEVEVNGAHVRGGKHTPVNVSREETGSIHGAHGVRL